MPFTNQSTSIESTTKLGLREEAFPHAPQVAVNVFRIQLVRSVKGYLKKKLYNICLPYIMNKLMIK